MEFRSILYPPEEIEPPENEPKMPDSFPDLNLDIVVNRITSDYRYREYELQGFFFRLLKSRNAITYRQQIIRDMQKSDNIAIVRKFIQSMKRVKGSYKSVSSHAYRYQNEIGLLNSAGVYCDAVTALSDQIRCSDVESAGLRGFAEFLQKYVNPVEFKELAGQTAHLTASLHDVKYSLIVKDDSAIVRKFVEGKDYTTEIISAFEQFGENEASVSVKYQPASPGMNPVEMILVELIANFYPGVFRSLGEYYAKNAHYIDPVIQRFEREIQFYLSYLDYISPLTEANMKFCIPSVSETDRNIYVNDGFNIALAAEFSQRRIPIVCNDFHLEGDEHIAILTGRNQGGKTTFARSIGQITYLACLGLPVPGKSA